MQAPAQDNAASHDEQRNIGVTQPRNRFDQTPPPMSNDSYSESLTRLQTGYLHAISTLEGRIAALEHDLANARTHHEHCDTPPSQDEARRISDLENENELLQLELDAQKTRSTAYRAELRGLKVTLETKNAVMKEQVSKILHLEQANRRLKEENGAGRKTDMGMGRENAMGSGMGRGGGAGLRGGTEEMRKRKRHKVNGGWTQGSVDDPMVL